jgi:uncharacterized lipoprotein YmbA
MIERLRRFGGECLLFSLLLWLAACAAPSQPARFYRLQSSAPPMTMPQAQVPAQSLPLVGVGPVRLATYLDQPRIVERAGPHRLRLHEFDRWAGTLQENIAQVVSETIQRKLVMAQVVAYPWHSSLRPAYEVTLSIERFERDGERLVLDARWTLVAQPQGLVVGLGQRQFETPVAGKDMEATVSAASAALELLGHGIATELASRLSAAR